MSLQEAIELLEYYQAWRSGDVEWQVEPKKITEALNIVLEHAKKQN